MKRLVTVCTLFLIFILSGCGKKEVKHESYVYIPHSEVIADDAMVFYSTFRNNKLYYIEGRLEVGQIVYSLCITDYLTEQAHEQELTVYKNESIVDICVNTKSEVVLLTIVSSDDFKEYHYALNWLDESGNVYKTVVLSDETGEIEYINKMETDASDNVVLIANDRRVLVYDTEGTCLKNLEHDYEITGIGNNAKGSVVITYVTIEGNQVAALNQKTGEPEKATVVTNHPVGNNAVLSDGDGNMYIRTDKGLYQYWNGMKDKEEIINWVLNGITSNTIESLSLTSEGDIVVITKTYADTGYEIRCSVFDRKKPEEVTEVNETGESQDTPNGEKEVITIVTYSQEIEKLAVKFNLLSSRYAVEIRSCNVEETDMKDWIARMNADIVAGGIVDMVDTAIINYAGYADKGILADISGYMEQDESFIEEDYWMNVINAYEYKDGVYAMPLAFETYALFSDGATFDENGELSLSSLKEYLNTHDNAELFYNMCTPGELLRNLVACGYEDYVDTETGKASFDSKEFKELLEISQKYSSTVRKLSSKEKLKNRQILFGRFRVFHAPSYQFLKTIFGEDMVFTGFPTKEGHEAVIEAVALSICANSGNKDGAWEFIRFCMEEKQQSVFTTSYSPINRKSYEGMMTRYSTPAYKEDVNGQKVEVPLMSGGFNGEIVDIYALTEEEVGEITAWYESLDTAKTYNSDVMDIIQEEASAYFDGNMDVETVASNIQNRVQMLLYEGM